MNRCRGCEADFGSVGAFDRHRVGRHAYTFAEGLDEFGRENGRRCLDSDELEAKGWRQDSHGRWRMPRRVAEDPFWDARNAVEASGRPSGG